jgi:hypothetical protein
MYYYVPIILLLFSVLKNNNNNLLTPLLPKRLLSIVLLFPNGSRQKRFYEQVNFQTVEVKFVYRFQVDISIYCVLVYCVLLYCILQINFKNRIPKISIPKWNIHIILYVLVLSEYHHNRQSLSILFRRVYITLISSISNL